MVRTQAQTTRCATSHLTDLTPRVVPTPKMQPVMVWVVLTGMPSAAVPNKEIAAALGIVEGTVKRHLQNILAKLHLRNRVELATFAVSRGLARSGPRPRPSRRP